MKEKLEQPSDIKSYLKTKQTEIDDYLKSAVPLCWKIPSALRESVHYSLLAGGKRIRPILVLAAAESLGARHEDALPIACAIEMMHAYSLIHDDLPALDNDDYRRGKLTNHKVYGEATALLAGDALLTQAFYQIARAARENGLPAQQALAIVEDLAELSGISGMVGGQAADMAGEQGETTLEELEYIHQHKTADLIAASLITGGRIGNADEKQRKALHSFGRCLGLAFQIQDDILDVIGDAKKLGKAVNSDVLQEKVTYPYLLGLDASRRKVDELTAKAKQALQSGGISKPERLLQIADYLMSRDR